MSGARRLESPSEKFRFDAVALIEAAAQQAIVYEIAADYLRRTGLEATLFVSRAAAGTRLTVL